MTTNTHRARTTAFAFFLAWMTAPFVATGGAVLTGWPLVAWTTVGVVALLAAHLWPER